MPETDADRLADRVLEAHKQLERQLHGKGQFPRGAFDVFFQTVVEYVEATKDSPLVHRSVVSELNGLTEMLELDSFKTPSDVLYQADRLECIFFLGYDPHFEGDEPPGL